MLRVWGMTEATQPRPDYAYAALRAQLLGARAYRDGRTDMCQTDRDEIARLYGLVWDAMGEELHGDWHYWFFQGVEKAARP